MPADAGVAMDWVPIELSVEVFRFWNVSTHAWRVEADEFEIRVGASSRSLPLKQKLHL
ncbi:MAG: fibronectin type III-like domain-contianing protein [Opitutaceae bacterium]|nr:fibronectin type III-like domain-contianing protein [Opitutaceae bacterium]